MQPFGLFPAGLLHIAAKKSFFFLHRMTIIMHVHIKPPSEFRYSDRDIVDNVVHFFITVMIIIEYNLIFVILSLLRCLFNYLNL